MALGLNFEAIVAHFLHCGFLSKLLKEELLGWSLQDNDHFEVNINPKESPLQSKDAEALKPLVLPSFGSPRCCLEEVCLPRNARTETILLYSSVPCETVEPSRRGVASNMFLQKEQKAIRHTSEESVSNDCVNEPSSESDSSRHSRPFAYQLLVANQKERKSVCLWSARRKVVAILLGLLMVVCFVGIAFIVQAIRKKNHNNTNNNNNNSNNNDKHYKRSMLQWAVNLAL
ncbi:hypothetical protein OS493_027068 [Desmophyllum pertusum]|uniref:Uncharacterized protein n=1 Tax=Desmophyllum pertusum TaxID=174260 RepID=A0A9W9Y9G5_9CNID|nr:hypothetical protein OS493_027068 [Desmophyllum pertusum]